MSHNATGGARQAVSSSTNVASPFPTSSPERNLIIDTEPLLPRDTLRLKAAGLGLGLFCFLVLLWQLTVSNEWTSQLVVPAPLDVLHAMRAGLFTTHGSWWPDVWATLRTTLIGFAAGVSIALVLGTVFTYVTPLRLAAHPYIILLQAFPKVAMAPILVSLLGYGDAPKVVIAASLAFFPVFTNTVAGMSEVNPDESRLMKSLGASRFQDWRYLRLPNTLPYIFAAMDVAIVVSLLGVIVGEFVGSRVGLGYRILDRTAFGDTASVYAAIFLLGFLGLALRQVALYVQSRVVFRE